MTLVCLLLFSSAARGQEILDRSIHYRPGDWVTYPMARFVTSLALGNTFVYFGTTHGILRYDFFSDAWDSPFTVSDGMADDRIRVVAYDFDSGMLWCATETGMGYYMSGAGEWRNFYYEEMGLSPVNSIGSGRESIWIENADGLWRSPRQVVDFWRASEQDEIEDDVRWSGMRSGNGIDLQAHYFMDDGYVYLPEGTIQDTHLRRFSLTESVKDAFFHFWFGTWGRGGGYGDLKAMHLRFLPFGPFLSDIRFMAWDDAGMWMGGREDAGEGGVSWWDMDLDAWEYFEAPLLTGLRSDRVTSIAAGPRFVWFGTDDGLARYDKNKNAWRTFGTHDNLWDNRITTLALGEDALWVGTAYGLNRVALPESNVDRVTEKAMVHRRVHQVEVDGGNVWAVTDLGIYVRPSGKKRWDLLTGPPGLLYQETTAVSAFEDEVWFGMDDGVFVYRKTDGSTDAFPRTHYPTGGRIHTILADIGAVWVGTEEGLLKYIKEEDRWRRFTMEDGLPDDSVRWILLDGDYLWLGTGRGLTRFYWNAPYRTD